MSGFTLGCRSGCSKRTHEHTSLSFNISLNSHLLAVSLTLPKEESVSTLQLNTQLFATSCWSLSLTLGIATNLPQKRHLPRSTNHHILGSKKDCGSSVKGTVGFKVLLGYFDPPMSESLATVSPSASPWRNRSATSSAVSLLFSTPYPPWSNSFSPIASVANSLASQHDMTSKVWLLPLLHIPIWLKPTILSPGLPQWNSAFGIERSSRLKDPNSHQSSQHVPMDHMFAGHVQHCVPENDHLFAW